MAHIPDGKSAVPTAREVPAYSTTDPSVRCASPSAVVLLRQQVRAKSAREEGVGMYEEMIREALARVGLIGVEPRHVEAWMRLEHGTLDALGEPQFQEEVEIAAMCVKEAGAERSEGLAKSYGL